MKTLFSFCLYFLILSFAVAQQTNLSRLQQKLSIAKNEDTIRVFALDSLAVYYGFIQFDSCLFYAAQTTELSQKLNYTYGRFLGYRSTFFALNCQGNYPKALEVAINMQKIAEKLKKDIPWTIATPHYFIGLLNREMANYSNAIDQFQQAIQLWEKSGQPMAEMYFTFSQLGMLYGSRNQLDSALLYAQKGYNLGLHSKDYRKFFALAIGALGNIHVKLHNYKLAESLFRAGIVQSGLYDNIYFQARNYNNLASLFNQINLTDSSVYYAKISLQLCQKHNFGDYTFDASSILSKVYESENKPDSAFKYIKIMLAAKDSVFSQSKGLQFQQTAFKDIQRLQEISTDKERYQYHVKVYALLATLSVFLLLSFILYRNTLQKQKAKIKIQQAYEELKATQAQLVQREKMASLGELTAGIAHEIQNPLNFVNNFSEVNKELLVEMKEEINKGNMDEVKAIANDVIENEEKINHHGKRADDIVKGMLQHSRINIGVKEPANINALVDEHLRLSYNSLRAKDKTFNATLKTDFDETIGNINIIPQDIGRVLLNLYNNAFYAVNEKLKAESLKPKAEEEIYEPTISVTTKKVGDKIFVSVKDNGNGIPQKIVDKIFQPFFTTKPTGQGTGLGLSLSYDIVKAHGGEIKVETKEGEGTEFIIQLPVV